MKEFANNKKKMISLLVFGIVMVVMGVTYAFFNYTRTGPSNRLITGSIYLTLNEGTDQINLTNVFPMTKEEARTKTDNVIEFTISGLNESKKDIWYEIDIKQGDAETGKVRINDEDLVFDLVEIGQNNEETYIVDAKSYSDITNKRIWVDTVDHNTTTEIVRTYKLRVWVRDDILISDTDPNRTYCARDNCVEGEKSFYNHFASVKVGVIGDFQEKDLPGAYNMLKKNADTTTEINFGNKSSDTNGKGLYLLKGTENDTNPIYYYRGNINNNNVVFGDFCWQMVRTTDTGGIKMIYNGVTTGTTENPTCENTEASRQLAQAKAFNTSHTSMSDVGYMYNKRYPYQSRSTSSEIMLSTFSLNTTYWYADSVTWGSPTANKYNLDNPYQVSSTSDYPNLVGKYTFRNTSQTYTGTAVYYIEAVNNTTMYYIYLDNTGNHTLADFNHTYTYGDGYTDLGNGTYEITDTTSVTTINRSDWYTSYSNLNNKYVCKNATNNTCSEVWYVTSTTNTNMTYLKVSTIKFFKGISNYNSTTGTYTLDNDNSVSFWDITNTTNKTSLNNHHYTCWNTSGTCTTLSYIYYVDGTTYYYINLTGGELVEDALYKMTGNGTTEVKNRTVNQDYELNTTDSAIKAYIESWFKTNLTNEEDSSKINYQEYLEDTIYCNDRSYQQIGSNTLALSGWNPDGGSVTSNIYFNTNTRFLNSNWYSTTNKPTFSCPNETDSFSVSNNKAKLKYPVGLLTGDEIILAGAAGNSSVNHDKYYLYNYRDYWSLSPSFIIIAAAVFMESVGTLTGNYAYGNQGVSPAVSLKPGIEFEIGGDGTPTNPYVVKYN